MCVFGHGVLNGTLTIFCFSSSVCPIWSWPHGTQRYHYLDLMGARRLQSVIGPITHRSCWLRRLVEARSQGVAWEGCGMFWEDQGCSSA